MMVENDLRLIVVDQYPQLMMVDQHLKLIMVKQVFQQLVYPFLMMHEKLQSLLLMMIERILNFNLVIMDQV